jgi:hypothetical protein
MTGLLSQDVRKETGLRVRDAYRRIPGLSPTFDQARRLFGLTDEDCRAVLDALVRSGYLSRNRRGRYVSRDR